MKLTKIFLGIVAVFLLSSFNTEHKKPKEKAFCGVSCAFSPTTTNFSSASIENCTGGFSGTSTIVSGTSWTSDYVGSTCPGIYIETSLPGVRPSGTLRIYKNGVLVLTRAVPKGKNNVGIVYTDYFSAGCDHFTVTW